MDAATTNPTATHDGDGVRRAIRRHAEVLRRPDGFPERMVLEALGYLYGAYALGSRTAAAELDLHFARCRHLKRPSPEVALALARGFLRLAGEAVPASA